MVKFFGLFAVLMVLFFIQQQRILSVNDVNPNLIFVVLLAIAFFQVFRLRFLLLLLLLFFFVSGFWAGGFWFFQILVLGLIALGTYFLKPHLSGSLFWDFLIVLAVGHFLFYLVVNVAHLPDLPWLTILAELVYNLVLGGIAAISKGFCPKIRAAR